MGVVIYAKPIAPCRSPTETRHGIKKVSVFNATYCRALGAEKHASNEEALPASEVVAFLHSA